MAEIIETVWAQGATETSLDSMIASLGSVAVAFSGGTDSTLLLAVALRILGAAHVVAITADSPSLPRAELEECASLAQELGARHIIVPTKELSDQDYASNPRNRCFYCKRELFAKMREIATSEGFQALIYGATASDTGDFRPGMLAAAEAGAVAPLLDAGLTKQDVRQLSRELGLRTWDKPASACLASRVPYDMPITAERLGQVEQAERFVRQELGIRQVRVRHHGSVARIEVEEPDLPRLFPKSVRVRLAAELQRIGFTYVTVDLQGFRSGSMNEA